MQNLLPQTAAMDSSHCVCGFDVQDMNGFYPLIEVAEICCCFMRLLQTDLSSFSLRSLFSNLGVCSCSIILRFPFIFNGDPLWHSCYRCVHWQPSPQTCPRPKIEPGSPVWSLQRPIMSVGNVTQRTAGLGCYVNVLLCSLCETPSCCTLGAQPCLLSLRCWIWCERRPRVMEESGAGAEWGTP